MTSDNIVSAIVQHEAEQQAEIERLEAEVTAEHELNRGQHDEIERLRVEVRKLVAFSATESALKDAEIAQLREWKAEAEQSLMQAGAALRERDEHARERARIIREQDAEIERLRNYAANALQCVRAGQTAMADEWLRKCLPVQAGTITDLGSAERQQG